MAQIAPDQMLGDLDTVDALIARLTLERNRLVKNEPDARENLISSARELITSLETPLESILWTIWAEPTRTFASRIALDLDLFQTLVQDGGRPKTVEELAAPKKASPLLVNRIARKLATMNMLTETSSGVYEPSKLTHVLTIPKYSEGIRFCYDTAGPSFVQMAEYFEKRGLHNPDDPNDGPFQFATKTPNAFVWMTQHPKVMQAFYAYIHGQREDRPRWDEDDFYPVQKQLVDGVKLEGDASALIDVGGGVGQVLEDFRVRHPQWKGRLVLQELPFAISHAKTLNLNERIELHEHDFFTEQPIKGARAYYMRYVLHDWNDEHCLRILARLKDAMEPGYSRILINDCVVADKGAAWQHTSLDLFMMAIGSSYERTESEWRRLIADAGLKIGGIYSKGLGNESLIEVLA